MSNKIVAVMLVTGEELIGELIDDLRVKNSYKIQKPRVVAIMRSPDGRQGLGLVPWTKSNMDSTVEIFKSQLVCELFEPVQEVTSAYLQETSGIQLASSLPPAQGGIIQ